MENNESEKQNFKFPERWGVCAIILLPFLLFISGISYITEFSNFGQYLISCAILSAATWSYYDFIKMFEIMENVIRDEKTLKLLHREKEENKQLGKKILESQKEKEKAMVIIDNLSATLKEKEEAEERINEMIREKTTKMIEENETLKKVSEDVKKVSEDVKKRKEEINKAIEENERLEKEIERLKKENEELKKGKEIRMQGE